MEIRKFIKGDEKELSKLIINTLVNVNSNDYPKDIIKNMISGFSPEKILSKSKKRDIYVVLEENKIVGTGSLHENTILSVFIDSNLIGKGIGKKLMTFLEKQVKGNGFEFTELPSSLTGLNFYRKMGYTDIKEVEDEIYGKVILMRKKLN